jgi:glycine/D-amino acid oxidase-like deaminating enzyme
MNTADVIVVGGGLVGTAVAYGLSSGGARVTVLDGEDDAYRASRGNFGLVWVQGKGYKFTPYARWTIASASRWPLLQQQLLEDTGVDVQLQQPGGFSFCYSESLFQQRRERLESIRKDLGGDYPFEMLDNKMLRERLPQVGPDIVGASYTPMDGHANPLKLLRALHAGCVRHGATIRSNQQVGRIEHAGGVFRVHAREEQFQAPKVVLAAGLGNSALAQQVGLLAPVVPQRGQLMVSERTTRFLDHPTLHVRQTDEGTIQVGDSLEDVGYDDATTNDVLTTIARRSILSFPALAKLNLVRVWGALRVMSPDGFPIYQQSHSHPGAYVVTCHSGVTLAANHALQIAPWIAGGAKPGGIDVFAGDRFLNKH